MTLHGGAHPKMTHTEWQAAVVDLARATGWRHLHVRRTRGRGGHWTTSTNLDGWPDLFLWNVRRVGGGYAAVELKVGRDLPTQAQLDVLAEHAAAGARTCVAYPTDLDALVDVLQGRSMGWVYEGRVRT